MKLILTQQYVNIVCNDPEAMTAAHRLGIECTMFWTVSIGITCHAA